MTMGDKRFQEWLTGAQKGSSIVYHVGPYAYGSVCRAALEASDAGLICLTRKPTDRPHRRREFEYIATRTMKWIGKK